MDVPLHHIVSPYLYIRSILIEHVKHHDLTLSLSRSLIVGLLDLEITNNYFITSSLPGDPT